jgi:hypothetical protein
MNNRLQKILGLGSVVAVLAIGGAALFNGAALTQHSEIVYMTDGPTYSDVTDLTKASKAVAHVKIVSVGNAYTIPFDNAAPVVGARPSGNPEKDKAGPQTSTIPASPAARGLLKTDFTVEVLENVHGAGIKKGDHIVVSQLGGTVSTKRPDGVSTTQAVANTEHDPLMQVGDEEVLFLNQDAASGKFFTTGGGGGRFKVQSNGTLFAVDHESPASKIVDGKPTNFLKNAVRAVN